MLKPFFKYFGLFCLSYIGLYFLLGLAPVNSAHRSFYFKIANPFLHITLPKAYVSVEKGIRKETGHGNMVSVKFANQAEIDQLLTTQMKANARQTRFVVPTKEVTILFTEFAVIPLVFLLSLILVTPMAWKQKTQAVLWGLFFFYLFLLIKTHFAILDFISQQKIGVHELGPAASSIVSLIHYNLKVGASMMVGTVIWVLVAFRKSNWRQMIASLSAVQKK